MQPAANAAPAQAIEARRGETEGLDGKATKARCRLRHASCESS